MDDWTLKLPLRFDLRVDAEKQKERENICKSCDQLHMNFCSFCKCYMPVKTWIKDVNCPLDKWS